LIKKSNNRTVNRNKKKNIFNINIEKKLLIGTKLKRFTFMGYLIESLINKSHFKFGNFVVALY